MHHRQAEFSKNLYHIISDIGYDVVMIQFADIPGRSSPLFTVAGQRVRLLGGPDAPALQRLFDRCGDYFELPEGRPARPDAALDTLRDSPSDGGQRDAFSLGIDGSRGELAGFIDTWRDDRRPTQWSLDLLLLDPAWRGRGIGSTAYWALQHWIIAQGGDSIALADGNDRGRRVWQSLGFAKRSHPTGLKRHTLTGYEKDLRGLPATSAPRPAAPGTACGGLPCRG
jgi:GNAT superfamily N-acetyltransferase